MSKLVRFGIGGPVGSGKTHLLLRLCQHLKDKYSIITITNDIYTREDAQFLTNQNVLEPGRIMGVETGGCPHNAIRDDISSNLDALELMHNRFGDAQLAFIESGGDNLSATFSPDLVDYHIYIIDVAQGDDIPRKGGIGIARADLLLVNKIDLAPYVGSNLEQVKADLQAVRGPLPFLFTNMKTEEGIPEVCNWVAQAAASQRGEETPLWAQAPALKSGKPGAHHHHH